MRGNEGLFPIRVYWNPEYVQRSSLGPYLFSSANGEEADEGFMIG